MTTTVITNMTLYRAIVLKNGLDLYLSSQKRIIPNRSWTPTNMLRAATEVTGLSFKRGEHNKARDAVARYIESCRLFYLKGETLQDEKPMVNHEALS